MRKQVCWAVAASLVIAALSQARSNDVAIRSFERQLLVEETAEASAGVSIGDLNGDGWLDIVLAKGRHTPLYNRVLLSDRTGRFIAANLGVTPDRSYSAELADIDADGDLDVVVGNDLPDRKLVFKNDGKGNFTLAGSWGEPSWPTRYVTLADLNGDGFPDIVAANAGASLPLPIPYPSFMCLNDGTGAFPSCRPLPSESAVRIVSADFDANGAIDLFVGHRDGGRNFILWNSGPARFAERTAIGPDVSNIRVAAVGDFNGDGLPDLVVCDDRRKTTAVFLNAGGRAFHGPISLPTGNRTPYAVSAADLNHDGHTDIVVGYVAATGSVYFMRGDGHSFVEAPWNDGKGDVYQIAFGDLDRDGWTDIVAARSGAPNGIWFSSKPAR